MNVLVNAISIKEGGSLVAMSRLLLEAARLEPAIAWHVCAHPNSAAVLAGCSNIHVHPFAAIGNWPGALAYFYEVVLGQLARKVSADVMFSMTNYLPYRTLPLPTLLLIQHAGHFSETFSKLTEAAGGKLDTAAWRLKSRWVKRSATRATRVTVQTAALADDITSQLAIPASRILVVPHGTGLTASGRARSALRHNEPVRLGYVTKYGVQKNFELVLRAVADLKTRGKRTTLSLTLQRGQHRHDTFDALLPLIRQLNIEDSVECHGEVTWEQVPAFYDKLDVFVFPSLCESFGFPLVEAMASGLPVVVAATRSNLEVAGDGAPSFAPDAPSVLADHIQSLSTDPALYAAQSARSLIRATNFSWTSAAAGILAALRDVTSQHRGVTHQ